jgi:hypothetical protein
MSGCSAWRDAEANASQLEIAALARVLKRSQQMVRLTRPTYCQPGQVGEMRAPRQF